ncbi:polyamine deacetylase HDAC10 [Aplysia californica]|uniref:Polyamine deacetylase HDAC10 n=1 Tax=Aplysia californica TaxID=6500 RepID=A0ABM0JNK1_APLCA|nr:polyamine deacetylase HDAC10 [Aplysia californica]
MMLPQEERRTGVVYDSRLSSHFSAWNKDFTEKPQRNTKCIERCTELGLLKRCLHVPVREATEAEMMLCHTRQHIELLRMTESMNGEELKAISQKYDFIYFHQKSFENAKLSLGGVIDLVDKVVSEQVRNGMAIVRPPGHHAMKEEYCGYCYLSNAAIAAKSALEKYNLKRILILDWDVHHGQGTQFAFYDDPRVLFVSIHRYELGSEWPHLRESDYDFIGEGPGKGYTINIPLNETGCGNSDYLSIFFNLLLPVFYEFDPELIIVSAGFDSAIGCPEGEMLVTPACFAHFVNLLTPLASGKLALLLEGGYNLKSLAESTALCVRALLGDPTPNIAPLSAPKPSVVESVLNCIKILHPYWHCLEYQDVVESHLIKTEAYPFKQVLNLPPVQNIEFYTSETRPQTFPLIQDCADDNAIKLLEEYNQAIDKLIQETDLSFPASKFSLSWDKASDGVIESLTHSDVWKQCQKDVSSPQTIYAESVHAAIDSILLSKSQSSLCLVSRPARQHNGTPNGAASPTAHSAHGLAASYAVEAYQLNRVLIIQMGSGPDVHIPTSPSVLSIVLSLSSDGSDSARASLGESFVSLPLKGDSLNDVDYISAFQQIVLPLAYEFGPTLTVFSWQSLADGVQGPSPACISHLTMLLRGLSRGRLMVLVDRCAGQSLEDGRAVIQDPSEARPSPGVTTEKLLMACASVLAGHVCAPLGPGYPSQHTAQVIKNVQDELKGKWSLLQFRHQIPKLGQP